MMKKRKNMNIYQKTDDYIKTIRKSAPLEGKNVALPGDDRLLNYRNNMKNGLEWKI